MGPNLTRLFDTTKDGDPFAPVILGELFAVHGEALIAALDDALDSFKCTQVVQYCPEYHWAPRAQKLLAQLEREAQP